MKNLSKESMVERLQRAVRAMGIETDTKSVPALKKMLKTLGITVPRMTQFAPHHKKNPTFAAQMRRENRVNRVMLFPCGHPRSADNVLTNAQGFSSCRACRK